MNSWQFYTFDRRAETPLYRQLADQLAADIQAGVFSHLAPLPSLSELCTRHGLARNTVISALRALVRDGHASARHGKGFFVVQPQARPAIDLIAPLHSHYYLQVYASLIAGAQDAAERENIRIDFADSREQDTEFLGLLLQVARRRPTGRLIAVPPQASDGTVSADCVAALEAFVRGGGRAVVVDRAIGGNLPCIQQDQVAGRSLLLRRAIQKGCRRILLVESEPQHEERRALVAGLASWAGELLFSPSLPPAELLAFAQRKTADAVLCVNDLQARRLVNLVEGELPCRVAGYDATLIATTFAPRITTVNSNLAGAGSLAIRLLTGSLDGLPLRTRIEPFLVDGDTL